jgi:serine/threonine protein kinase
MTPSFGRPRLRHRLSSFASRRSKAKVAAENYHLPKKYLPDSALSHWLRINCGCHAPVSPRQLNPDVPAELERILIKALEKDRDIRYQTASDLQADLKRLQRDRERARNISEVDAGPLLGPTPRALSRRKALVAGLLVTLLGGLGIGWYFWPKTIPPVWRAVPLTSYPGFEWSPALSPDGNQVAFSWNGASAASSGSR